MKFEGKYEPKKETLDGSDLLIVRSLSAGNKTFKQLGEELKIAKQQLIERLNVLQSKGYVGVKSESGKNLFFKKEKQ